MKERQQGGKRCHELKRGSQIAIVYLSASNSGHSSAAREEIYYPGRTGDQTTLEMEMSRPGNIGRYVGWAYNGDAPICSVFDHIAKQTHH